MRMLVGKKKNAPLCAEDDNIIWQINGIVKRIERGFGVKREKEDSRYKMLLKKVVW